MNRKRWQQIDAVFKSALDRGPRERNAFLDKACRNDAILRNEVESLIAHDQAGSFMAVPAVEDATRLLTQNSTGSLLGQDLGSYKILRQLGEGGMGEVYLALHTTMNRKVALKLVSPYFINDAQRVWREALDASPETFVGGGHEMRHERGDVVLARAQGGNLDRHDVQPIVEVAAEFSGVH